MSKTAIRILIAALALLVLAAVAVGGIRFWRERQYRQAVDAAEALYTAGDYAAAKEAFLSLELPDRAADCDAQTKKLALAAAEKLLSEGQFAEAKEAFLALGDFENAPERALACDYAKAEHFVESERYAEAFALLEELGEYPGAKELSELAHETLYTRALEETYACHMDEAIELFNELGDYRDGALMKERCRERILKMVAGGNEPINYAEYAGSDIGAGKLYWHRLGQIYVPKDAGPETKCMIFFPGGYDESLPNGYMTEMIYEKDPPNAIMLFSYTNGFYSMADKIEDCYQALEQAGIENNVFLHDLVLCGASNGAYTACRAAAQLYEEHGLRASHVLTFDAGLHWELEDYILTPEECASTAKAGTSFVLLESGGVGMNKRAIELLVAHGNDVTVAECVGGGHEQIILDAIRYGMIDWALGKGSRPVNDNYTYYPLDPTSTYPVG